MATIVLEERKGKIIMCNKEDKTGIRVDINVTKIVKYACLAGVLIVGIIFSEKGYEKFVQSRKSSTK